MNKAEKTRQFIVEMTAPVFNQKGYLGTSLSDMTNATGLTKGSIYGNFANKDEVALAAFDHNLRIVGDILRQEMGKVSGCREKLLAYVRVYENFLKHPFPVGGCPIQNTAVEADDTHPMLKQKAAEALMNLKEMVGGLIKKGIEKKEFRSSINPEQMALTLISMIEGAIMIAKVTGKLNYKKSVIQAAEDLIHSF
ncbi:MAG TPA: TetR/AcrR family transcriptional regulator [Chitinophaga sp.]|uniref:TetR/AcrR family transcriptional regulator n=1 Tax=Chitinophaga sp. TaxID=1869181 RepID=UPI002C5F7939|nr:TetR/AcrR family transcriptional regulator [Chitinophaga sp.]HVI47820.1 TetR/AcrR family transcriptional regulator [Chitinophaga sp.]